MKDLKTKITIKGIMLYETLSGKSFYDLSAVDMVTFIYAIIVTNNPEMRITQEEFNDILDNEKLSRKILNGIQEELKYMQSLIPKDTDEGTSRDDISNVKVSEIVSNLVVMYGIDINYALNDMELWELMPLSKSVEEKIKVDMADKRFWTYLTILPHIDSKKCKTPEQLIPFPWEKDEKKKVDKEFLKENNDRIMNLFKQNNQEDDK